MYFLQKVFQLRDQTNPEAEKPFLEHLEDLRICITRMMVALIIATVTCFIFRAELMEIIRRPVEQVWIDSQRDALDKGQSGISPEQWEIAKQAAEVAYLLDPEQRELFFDKKSGGDDALRENVLAVYYFRAALSIDDKEARREFVEKLPNLDEKVRKKVLGLMVGLPNAEIDARGKIVLMQALKPTEGFMLSLKLALYAGLVVSFPFLLYFLLQFVLPGMHETERRALWPAMAVGFGLFLAGVFFAYLVVLPRVLEFFYHYSSEMKIENVWRIGYYISFATQFTLIFGLSFELPVVVMTLVKLGILNSEMMRRTRSYAILSIFVIAAIITPTPDAFTLLLLALPMVLLYEICIWLALFLERKERQKEAAGEAERRERLPVRKDDDSHAAPPPGHDEEEHAESAPAGDNDDDNPGAHDPYLTEQDEEEDVSDPWPEDDNDPEREE